MNCPDSRTLLIDRLTGELAGDAMTALEAHLQSCADCRATWAAWREAFDGVSTQAAPIAPPPEVKAALMARVRRETVEPLVTRLDSRDAAGEAALPPEVAGNSQGRFRRLWYVAAMLAGLLLGAAGTRYWWLHTGVDSAGNSSAEIAIADYRLHQALEAGMRGIEGAEWQLTALSSPRVDAEANAPHRSGLLAWDAVSQELHFYALGLTAPRADEVYRLWLIDDQNQWTRVGDLKSDGDVFQLLAATPLSWSHVRSFVVTLESASASPAGEHAPIILRSDL